MAKHLLGLNVPTITNTCILRVEDLSVYSDSVPFECPTLQITPPGFWQPANLTNLQQGFIINATACSLGIQLSNCDNYNNTLIDGVYVIRYSVSPNDTVYVEYNHLRLATALNKIQEVLCQLDVQPCTPPAEQENKLLEIQLIQSFFDAAKAQVEYAHHPREGMQLYNFAMERLNALISKCAPWQGRSNTFLRGSHCRR